MQVKSFFLSNDFDTLRESVVQVTKERMNPKVDERYNIIDLENTLADPRMGPVLGRMCATCGGDETTCKTGHFGHIDMGQYVIQRSYVHKLTYCLRSACCKCKANVAGQACATGKRCAGFRKVSVPKDGTLVVDDSVWSANQIRDYLQTVDEAVWTKLGIMNPVGMLARLVAVIPNCRRVYTRVNGEVKPHGVTMLYNQLLNVVNKLNACDTLSVIRNKQSVDLYIAYDRLFYAVLSTAPGSRDQHMGIMRMIQRKEGIMRSNMLGKRGDFCGRAVIRENYQLQMDQISIPVDMCSKLSVAQTVPHNDASLLAFRRLVEKGEWSSIKCRDGSRYDNIEGRTNLRVVSAKLGFGDSVNRWLRDEDSIVFLRQPTLHKGSMMKFRAVICKDANDVTLGMNILPTTPFNADFDGDEMHLFVPQSESARADIEELMDVKDSIINDNGKVQIYPTQNAMIAIYMLTRDDVQVPIRLFYKTPRFGKKPTYSGREFVSNCFPAHLNVFDSQNRPLLKDGLAQTALTSDHMKQIIFEVFQTSREQAFQMLNEVVLQTSKWVCERGLSLSIKDFIIESDIDFEEGDFHSKFAQAGDLLEKRADKNSMIYMSIKSGAKGSFNDFANVALIVGQQYVSSRPLPPFIGKRILPHQAHNDVTSFIARGIVTSNYIKGLSPQEMAIHAFAAKSGVILKAVGVRKSGDNARKLSQRLENIVVGYSGAVFDNQQNLIQFKYGDDGLDPKYSLFRKENQRPVEPAHAVGLIGAHSSSEPATQSMLDAFHHSGTRKGTSGDRLEELFAGSNLQRKGECKVKTKQIHAQFASKKFKYRVKELKWSCITRQPPLKTEWMERFINVFGYDQREFTLMLVFHRGPTTREVVMHVGFENVCASHHIHDGSEVILYASSDERNELQNILDRLKDPFVRLNNYRQIDELTVSCLGSLREVFFKFVYMSHLETISTCADDMLATFGIEATRTFLYNEFMSLSEFSRGLNKRHVLLLVDVMTHQGTISKLNYHGMKSIETSVLGMAAFEDPTSQLIEAAAHGLANDTNNMSECVMSGRLCSVGSGYDKMLVLGSKELEEKFKYQDPDDMILDNPALPVYNNGPAYYEPENEYMMEKQTYYDPTEDFDFSVQASVNDILTTYRPSTPPAAKKVKYYEPTYNRIR